ncbi:MAG: hypothetical protein ABIR17_07265, partial [Pseudolysinimonas sp.]|uniref:hypothetical protein n=1 Tax=Pseudolysinimonas sp. TaxID=2680009 RepID=UPI003263EFA1
YLNRRSGDAILLGEVNLAAADQRAFLGDEDGDELHMIFDCLGMQWEGSTIVAIHELAGRAVELQLPLDDGEALVDLFSDAEHALPATLRLERHAARWYRVRRAGQRLAP